MASLLRAKFPPNVRENNRMLAGALQTRRRLLALGAELIIRAHLLVKRRLRHGRLARNHDALAQRLAHRDPLRARPSVQRCSSCTSCSTLLTPISASVMTSAMRCGDGGIVSSRVAASSARVRAPLVDVDMNPTRRALGIPRQPSPWPRPASPAIPTPRRSITHV